MPFENYLSQLGQGALDTLPAFGDFSWRDRLAGNPQGFDESLVRSVGGALSFLALMGVGGGLGLGRLASMGAIGALQEGSARERAVRAATMPLTAMMAGPLASRLGAAVPAVEAGTGQFQSALLSGARTAAVELPGAAIGATIQPAISHAALNAMGEQQPALTGDDILKSFGEQYITGLLTHGLQTPQGEDLRTAGLKRLANLHKAILPRNPSILHAAAGGGAGLPQDAPTQPQQTPYFQWPIPGQNDVVLAYSPGGTAGPPRQLNNPNLIPFAPSKIPFETKSAQVKEAIDAGRVRKGKDTTTAYPPWVDKPGQFARYEATYGLKNLLDMLRRGRFVPEPTITPFTPAILTPLATPGTVPVGVPLPQPAKVPPPEPEPPAFGPQLPPRFFPESNWVFPPPTPQYGPSTTRTVTTTTPPLPHRFISGVDISRWAGEDAGQFAEPIRGTMHVLEPGSGVINYPDDLRVPRTGTKTFTERGAEIPRLTENLGRLINPNASIQDQLFHWQNDAETALAPHEDFLRSSLWGSIPTLLSEDAISTQAAVDRRRGILRNNTSGTEQWNADLAAAHTEAQQQQSEADRRASTNQPITWEHDLDILYQRNPRGKLPPAPAAEPASLPINTPEAMAKVKSPAEQAAEKVVRLGRRRPEGLRPTTAGALQLYNMFADMRGWDQNLDAVAGETYDPSAPIDIFGEPTYYKNDPSKSPAENKQLKLAFEEKQAEKFRQKDAFIDAIKSAQTIEIDNLGTLGKRVSFTVPSEDGKATTHTVDLTMAEHNDLMENVVAPSSNPNETRVGWTIASKDETTVRKEAAQEEEHAFLTERAPGTGATENDHSENAGRPSVFEEDKALEREDPWNPLGPSANTYLGTRWNPISGKRERVERPTKAANEFMGNAEEPYYRKTPIIDVVGGQDVEQTRINRQGQEVPSMRPIGQEPVWAETPKDAGQARKDRSWKRDRTTFGGTEVWDHFFLRDPDISPQDEARAFPGATGALRPEVKRILPQLVSLDKPPTAEMLPQLQYAMLTPEANKANAGYRKNVNNNIDNFYQSLIRNGVDKRTALELSQKVRNAGSLSNALNVLTGTTEPLPLRTIIDGMNAIGHGLSHGYTPGTDAMLSMTNKDGLPILGGYGATMDYTLPIQFTAGFGLGQKGGNKQPSGRLYFRLKPGTIPEEAPKTPAAPQQQPQPTPRTTRRTTYTPKFDALPAYVEGQKSMVYAGIGSKETPPEVQEKMKTVAAYLAKAGYTLNSGHAKGADQAFEAGAGDGPKNIFFATDATQLTRDIALEIHPTPQKIVGTSGLDLHARNTYQVFGKNLDSPVDFVIAWTPDGLESSEGRSIESGGTGQAIDMASRKGIPIINLANPGWESKLRAVLGLPQSQPAGTQQQPPPVKPTEPRPQPPSKINVWHKSGESPELSNLAERPFTLRLNEEFKLPTGLDANLTEIKFRSVEHAYQTLKSGTFNQDVYVRYRNAPTVEGLKINGGKADTRKQRNIELMRYIMEQSFLQNPEAAKQLAETGNAQLTHTQDKGVWRRYFPEILMSIRARIQANQ